MEGFATIAKQIEDQLNAAGFPPNEAKVRQALALAEEAGEFVGAARRYLGLARRTDTLEHVAEELADVVIVSYITAHVFGIDLSKAVSEKVDVIFSRGWRAQ